MYVCTLHSKGDRITRVVLCTRLHEVGCSRCMYCTQSIEYCTQSIEYCIQSIEYCIQSIENCTQSIEYCTPFIENCTQSIENCTQSIEYCTQSIEFSQFRLKRPFHLRVSRTRHSFCMIWRLLGNRLIESSVNQVPTDELQMLLYVCPELSHPFTQWFHVWRGRAICSVQDLTFGAASVVGISSTL